MNRDEAIGALKPCPYCGGEALYKDNEDWEKFYDPDTFALVDCNPSEADQFWVECEWCQNGTRICGSTEEAVDAWNKRDETDNTRLTAALAAITAERDALKADVAAAEARCGRLGRLLDTQEE